MRVDEKILYGQNVDLEEERQYKRLIKRILNYEDKTKINTLLDYLYDYTLKKDLGFVRKVYNYINEVYCDANIDIEKVKVYDEILKKLENLSLTKENKKKILEYIIYELRNLDILEYYLQYIINGYNLGEKSLKVLFEEVLKDSNEEDKNYFYEVIKMIIHYDVNNDIMLNKEHYLTLINNSNKDIIKLLKNNFKPEDVLLHYDIRTKFTSSGLTVKKKYPQNIRVDLTNQNVISIDNSDTNCIDDAFSITKHNDGSYTLYIYISDVSSLIDINSTVICDAYTNGETLYYSGGAINMLPDCLISKASLSSGDIRNVIAYKLKVDANYDIDLDSLEIIKGFITASHNLNVSQVDAEIQYGICNTRVMEDIMLMYDIADKLKKSNLKIRHYRNDIKLDTSISSIIVHEFMVLINSLLPKYFHDIEYPYIRRILHYDDAKISDIQRKFDKYKIKDANLKDVIRHSVSKAKYSTELYSHEGTGKSDYSHSTAPIRRFADLRNEYLINDVLENKGYISDIEKYSLENELNKYCEYLNKKSEELNYFNVQYNYTLRKLKSRK